MEKTAPESSVNESVVRVAAEEGGQDADDAQIVEQSEAESELEAQALGSVVPGGGASVTAPLSPPATSPPVGDGTEFLLFEPGGADGAESDALAPESVKAVVLQSEDHWRTPLASMEPLGARRLSSNSDDPVAVDVTDPTSPLTQSAVTATQDVPKEPSTGSLFTLIHVDKIHRRGNGTSAGATAEGHSNV